MKKRIISILLCLSMALSLFGCGKKSDSAPTTEADETSDDEFVVYNIAACLEDSNTYNAQLFQGFADAMTDYLGADHVKITRYVVSDETSSDAIATTVVHKNYDMIFTTGEQMLLSATTATEEIPIIATGIVDFQGSLRIATSGDSSWDKTTGINVTGVSSKPSIVEQVSLMIEATPDLQAVGILYSPEDTDAVYQNEFFEKYLDQAGIPWKEYSIPATDTAISEEEDQNTSVLAPTKVVAESAKVGVDNDVVSLGEDLITGINSPSSTRTALVSKLWTGGKVVKTAEDDVDNLDEADDASHDTEVSEDNEEIKEPESLEELMDLVCSECSVIYIPFGSMLTDQMETIGSIATNAGVSTVGGDTTIGANTLVTLFADPYALGYSAGKKATKVFNGSDISTIKIGYGDSGDCVKLYNKEVAEKLDMTFPKSFSEISDFLETYEYGSKTTRYVASEEEE